MAIKPIRIILTAVDQFTSTLGKASKDISKVGEKAKNIGMKMSLGLTLPTIAFGAVTLAVAGDFEAAMNKVSAITNSTGGELKTMGKLARQLGADTVFSATDAADAMQYLAKAGFKVNEIMTAAPGVMQLAAAGQVSMGEAADIVANVLRGYAFEANQVQRVNDVMAKTFTTSNTTIGELGEAFTYVGALARTAGLDFEEVSAALGILAKSGIKASMGGTALRGVIAGLLTPSGDAIKVFQKLKIKKADVIDSKGNLRSLADIIGVLGKTGAKTGDILTIFGDRAGPGVAVLMKEGKQGILDYQKTLKSSGGTAARIADIQMTGLNGAIENLKGAFQELQLAIADSGLLKWATDTVGKIADWINIANKFHPSILKFATIFAVVVAAIGPVVVAFGFLFSMIGSLVPAFTFIAGIISGVAAGPLVAIVVGVIGAVTVIGLMIAKSQVLGSVWHRLLPFLKLAGLVIKFVAQAFWEFAKFGLKVLVAQLDMLLRPLEYFLGLMDRLAQLVLPDWLLKKIGLDANVTAVSKSTADLAATSAGGKEKVEVKVKMEGMPRGTRVESKGSKGVGLGIEKGYAFGLP